MKLTEIKQILSARNLQLSKSLGQNFLHDQNQLRRIAEAAELTAGDKILEIGPGLGPLTEYLAPRAAETLAIEKDGRLVEFMREKFANTPGLQLLHADALDYVKDHRQWSDWKMVSNLPYSVASPILVELAQALSPPQRIVATLQLEVAERIHAPAAAEHYGLLSLLIQLRYETRGIFKIPSTCFFPEPDVDSACITLERRTEPLLSPDLQRVFTRLVKCAFSQRRKMMLKLLKQNWPLDRLTAAFEQLGLSHQIRAERVSLEQFVQLVRLLSTIEAGTGD